MRRLGLICLLFVNLFLEGTTIQAQNTFPSEKGERVRYNAYIEMPRVYLSGVSIIMNDDGIIKGTLFNEFGVTAIEFMYLPSKNKVKIMHVVKMFDKWYIKRVMRKDLAQLMCHLQMGDTEYQNSKQNIKYIFKPIEENEFSQ